MSFFRIIVRGILTVLLSECVVHGSLSLVDHVSLLHQYCDFSNSTSVINLYAFFCFLVYVVFLNCIQMSIMSSIWP